MGALTRFVSSFTSRFDGWENAATGLGGLRDKTTFSNFVPDEQLTDVMLANLYRGDDFARRIVDELPGAALRQGFDVERQGAEEDDEGQANEVSDEQADAKLLLSECKKWDMKGKVKKAASRARLFGKAAIVVGLDGDPATSVEDGKITKVLYLHVVDKRRMQVEQLYQDDKVEKFGEPEFYRIVGKNGAADAVVHESRMIVFCGAPTADDDDRYRWDDSVLQNVYRVLQQVNGNWQSACNLMSDASQGVYYVKGLLDVITKGLESLLQRRMAIVDMGKSSARSLIMDADGERYERVATPMGGLPEMTDRSWQRLAAAAGMPVTKLMGMSPAGMNATGEHDESNWYQCVGEYRSDQLDPGMCRLIRLFARALGLSEPDAWSVVFPSMYQMTPVEEATYRKTIADTDKVYADMLAVLPEEVALSRWGKGTYSPQMVIDLKARRIAAAAETKKLAEDAGKPDPVAPTPGQPDGGGNPSSLPVPSAPPSPSTRSEASPGSDQRKAGT